MAAAAFSRARALVLQLAPEDQIEIANVIVEQVSGRRLNGTAKKGTRVVKRNVDEAAKAIGSPLTGTILDARLEAGVSGKEKGIPASAAVRNVRNRLGV
jgi:hypothetical protein